MRKAYGVLVGLDVQPNSLNLVALVSDGKSLRLSGADHRILPAGVVEQGNWRNRELMCEVLRGTWRLSEIGGAEPFDRCRHHQ